MQYVHLLISAATQGLLQTVLHGRSALHAIHPMLLFTPSGQMTHLHVLLNAAHYPAHVAKLVQNEG